MIALQPEEIEELKSSENLDILLRCTPLSAVTHKNVWGNAIVSDSLTIDRYCSTGNALEIGTACAAELTVTFKTDALLEVLGTNELEGMTIVPRINFKSSGRGVSFGTFIVDEQPRFSSTVKVVALDYMARFNKPVTDTLHSSLASIADQACGVCGVSLASASRTFLNRFAGRYTLPTSLGNGSEIIWRQVIQWIAQMTCSVAMCDVSGYLTFVPLSEADDNTFSIDETVRYSSEIEEKDITITGITVKSSDNTEFTLGEIGYEFSIGGNNLLLDPSQINAISAKTGWFSGTVGNIKKFSYRPFSATTYQFPHLFPFDPIVFVKDGIRYNSIITHVIWKLNGAMTIKSVGETATRKGYASRTVLNAAQRAIIERIANSNVNDKLSGYEAALLALNERVNDAEGLHTTVESDGHGGKIYYFHDAPTLAASTHITRMDSSGIYDTNSGWNNGSPIWENGVSNGNMVMRTIATEGLDATWITTGELSADRIDTTSITIGSSQVDGLDTLLGGTISQVDVMYALSNSATVAPTSGWQTTAPTWQQGKYMWQKTVTTYANNSVHESTPTCIQGATGATGSDGLPGANGVGISMVTELYFAKNTSSAPTKPTNTVTTNSANTYSAWNKAMPTYSASYPHYFTCSEIKYTNGTYGWTDPVYAGALTSANQTAASAKSTANNASSVASSAQSTANAVNSLMNELTTLDGNVTKINGGKIATGSILAQSIGAGQINAGHIAAGAITTDKLDIGDMTNYCRVNAITADAYGYRPLTSSEISANYKLSERFMCPKEYKTNRNMYYLGDYINFEYNKDGDNKFLIEGDFYNSRNSGYVTLGFQVVLENGSSYLFCVEDDPLNAVISQGGYQHFKKTVSMPYQYSGHRVVKFVPGFYFQVLPTSTYWFAFADVSVRRATGGDITAGKIQSIDGGTYFDLDNNVLRTEKTQDGNNHHTELYEGGLISGIISEDNTNYVSVGLGSLLITPNPSSRTAVFYSPERLFIGLGESPENAFNDVLKGIMIYDETIDFAVRSVVSVIGGDFSIQKGRLRTGSPTNTDYAAVSHYRHSTTYAGGYVRQLNVGIGEVDMKAANNHNSFQQPTISFDLRRPSDDTTQVRLDISRSIGDSMGIIKLSKNSSTWSAGLELGSSKMWFNGNEISTSSSERYKTDITKYNTSVLPIVENAQIYSFKYKDDGETALTKYGLIIERQCPPEVVDNSGDAICLYSMTSILWKAVQELSEKIKILEDNRNVD